MPNPHHEQNRKLWDEIAEIHFRHPDYKVKEFLEGWSTLKPIELESLGDVTGKNLLHLFCQFGMDSLSWVRQGAVVTGVDISGRSIELANELKQQASLSADFVRSDVMDLIGKIDSKFDIVFQSHGTMCWIADINKWAEVIAHYLKPGGTFFVVDGHPIAYLFLEEGYSYFNKHPQIYSNEPDYCDRDYVWKEDSVEFQHTLGDITNALINAGLIIEELQEYNKGYYPIFEDWYREDFYYYPPGGPPLYPLIFSIKARKPHK
jgi:SAM-dependent methyltransferase